MSDDPRKKFNALRFRRMDELRRDHGQSAAARVVGAELFACLNSVSGQAWTSQATLVKRLGLDLRRVKRAIKSLDEKYFKIARTRGAVNFYTPIWASLVGIKSDDESGLSGLRSGVSGDKKHPGSSDKKHPGSSDKKHPLSPSRIPSIIPARASSGPHRALAPVSNAAGIQESAGENLKGQRDDGSVELKAIELFNGAGLDGFNIVSSLHEIDSGLPRLRLFRLIRGGAVTPNDLTTAALAVREYESRKTTRALSRSQGGAA